MPYYLHPKGTDMPTEYELIPSDWIMAYDRKDLFEQMQADGLTSTHQITFKARPYDTAQWQYREGRRFATCEYIPVPWTVKIATTAHHYAHLSVDKAGMVAYTPDDEHGCQDRQQRLTPGRYLERFLSDVLSVSERAALVAQVQAQAGAIVLKIATTTADVRAVYRNGPCSCMGGPESHTGQYWRESRLGGHMPCEVYADGPDLAVAYTGTLDRPSQRSVIWPAEKRYVRIYGSGPLAALLKSEGYSEGSDDGLDGARIRRIGLGDGRYLMPYIDGCGGADDDGPYFVLGSGDYDTSSTAGFVQDRPVCAHCDRLADTDNECGGDYYCDRCWDVIFTCDDCHETGFDEHYCVGDATLCGSCHDARHVSCETDGCDSRWIEEELDSDVQADRARLDVADLCEECAAKYVMCDACESVYHAPDSEYVCPTCGRSPRCARTADLLADAVVSEVTPVVDTAQPSYRLQVRSIAGESTQRQHPDWSPTFYANGTSGVAEGHLFAPLYARGTQLHDLHHATAEYRIVTSAGSIVWSSAVNGSTPCAVVDVPSEVPDHAVAF